MEFGSSLKVAATASLKKDHVNKANDMDREPGE
jgi:hypothetical protein